MSDIPKWGKMLVILAEIVFTVACASLVQQNVKQLKNGDSSNKKVAEITLAALLAMFGLIITAYTLWEVL